MNIINSGTSSLQREAFIHTDPVFSAKMGELLVSTAFLHALMDTAKEAVSVVLTGPGS